MGATKGNASGLTEGLKLALSDTNARRRILEVNQRDKRTLSAIDQRFRDLDRLVDYLIKHLDDPVPIDVPAAPMRKRHDTDMDIALDATIFERSEESSEQGAGLASTQGKSVSEGMTELAPESPLNFPEPPLPPRNSRRDELAATAIMPAPPSWQKPPGFKHVSPVRALLDDVMWLLDIKDGEGMLISLERLMVSHRVEGELAQFVQENETKLLNVYESCLGPFTRTVQGLDDRTGHPMPAAFLNSDKVVCVTELIRDGISLDSLLRTSPYSTLETCCVVSQLRRVGLATVT